MVHGQGKGWSWLSAKLLHHLGLNWVFPWIVQWRFGRDLSWVAYSHLNIRFITEVYTNRERKLYINAKYFLFTCVFCFAYKFICLKACSCSMITVTNCRHPQIPLSTAILSSFPPQYFADPIFSPVNICHTRQYQLVPKFPCSLFIQRMSTCQEKRHLPAQSQSH